MSIADLSGVLPRLHALRRVSQALARPLDLDELFAAAQSETSRAVDAQTFLLALYDGVARTIEVVRQVDCGIELPGGIFPLGSGLTSQVINTHRSQLIRRWSTEGPPIQVQYATNTPGLPESAIAVPLLYGEQVLGAIATYSYAPDAFDEGDLLMVETIADQVAVAIARLRHSDQLDMQIQRRISEADAIVAHMADALLVVDTAGRLVRLNHAARTLLCVDDTSIVLGQPMDHEQWGKWPLGAREVAETLAPMVDVLLRGQVPPGVEVELRAQGRRFVGFSGTPLFDPSGAVSGALLVARDLTERHEVERLKDEMLMVASHDLRVPVTVIKSQAQVLQRGIERSTTTIERITSGLGTIVNQADRLKRLLDLLLDLTQIESGRLQIQPARMDLRVLVASMISEIQITTEHHQLKLIAPREVLGDWDERRLQQVFGNLLTNAVKYSPNGGAITATIRVDKSSVTLHLRDPGVGLSADDLRRVFERYYRATGIRQFEGTGLGLYVCQGIVAAHGGRMWAESPGPGRGSTFCFTLPRRAAVKE